jgi:hypothetical protein
VKVSEARQIAPVRLYITRALTVDDGIVIVVRDSGMLGHGCGINVLLDGEKAAFIGAGEKATFPASAGPHLLTILPSDKGLCKLGRERQERSLAFTAKPSDTMTFRLGLSASGDPVFYQSSL